MRIEGHLGALGCEQAYRLTRTGCTEALTGKFLPEENGESDTEWWGSGFALS